MKTGKIASHARKIDNFVKVKKACIGRGVFARRKVAPDTVIGEITGRVRKGDYESTCCIDLGGKDSLEPDRPFRFLNHSCQPNCRLIWWKYRRIDGRKIRRLWVEAIGHVDADEELTIDYAWPADAAIPCQCGTNRCRGWIVDRKELRQVKKLRRLSRCKFPGNALLE